MCTFTGLEFLSWTLRGDSLTVIDALLKAGNSSHTDHPLLADITYTLERLSSYLIQPCASLKLTTVLTGVLILESFSMTHFILSLIFQQNSFDLL